MIIRCQIKKNFLAGFTGLEVTVIICEKHEQNMRPTLTKSVCSTIRNAKCVRAEKPGINVVQMFSKGREESPV